MQKFTVFIEEIVGEKFEVEAKDSQEAVNIAKEKYRDGTFVLEPGNLMFKRLAVADPQRETTEWLAF